MRNKKRVNLISTPNYVKIIEVDDINDIRAEISSILSHVGYKFETDLDDQITNLPKKDRRIPQIITAYHKVRVPVKIAA